MLNGQSGSGNYTVTFDQNGVQVFPCRCGETHVGDYAEYEFAQHNCDHDATLLFVDYDDPESEGDAICPLCGKTWAMRHAA
jgi:hypothetical protein